MSGQVNPFPPFQHTSVGRQMRSCAANRDVQRAYLGSDLEPEKRDP
jgi:hypothetical protein